MGEMNGMTGEEHYPRLCLLTQSSSSSFKSKVERLLQQMESEDVNVPQNVEIDELRDALVKYINNKKLLRMYRYPC